MATKVAEGTKFNVHVIGNVTGKVWSGDFRSKPLLSFRDQMNVDKLKREFLGGNAASADRDAVAQATIIAELAFRLTDSPEWWRASAGGLDLADPNVLEAVYTQVREIEETYLKEVTAEAEKAKEAISIEVAPPAKK